MHRVSMYGWPKPKLHQVKKKLLYPRFSPRQIISFQLHHSQRTLTGVHSCVSKQRLCSRYNILSSIGRKGPFIILHLQQILYAKFYVSQNIFYFDMYIFICTYCTYKCMYIFVQAIHTNTYLSLTDSLFPLHQSQIASEENKQKLTWLVAGCHCYFLLVILSPSKLLGPHQEHTANWINCTGGYSATVATVFSRTSLS